MVRNVTSLLKRQSRYEWERDGYPLFAFCLKKLISVILSPHQGWQSKKPKRSIAKRPNITPSLSSRSLSRYLSQSLFFLVILGKLLFFWRLAHNTQTTSLVCGWWWSDDHHLRKERKKQRQLHNNCITQHTFLHFSWLTDFSFSLVNICNAAGEERENPSDWTWRCFSYILRGSSIFRAKKENEMEIFSSSPLNTKRLSSLR